MTDCGVCVVQGGAEEFLALDFCEFPSRCCLVDERDHRTGLFKAGLR